MLNEKPVNDLETSEDPVTDHKYMEKYNSDVVEDFSWDMADQWFFSSKPEDFEDEALRNLASDYVNKGYYITDEKVINEVSATGFGLGEYAFVTGFEAVDSKDGNVSHKAEVLKMIPEQYSMFIADFFDADEKYDEEKDGNTVVIKFAGNTLTYNSANEILVYEADLSGTGVG